MKSTSNGEQIAHFTTAPVMNHNQGTRLPDPSLIARAMRLKSAANYDIYIYIYTSP